MVLTKKWRFFKNWESFWFTLIMAKWYVKMLNKNYIIIVLNKAYFSAQCYENYKNKHYMTSPANSKMVPKLSQCIPKMVLKCSTMLYIYIHIHSIGRTCGMWYVVCGMWYMVYGIWYMVYGVGRWCHVMLVLSYFPGSSFPL